MERSTLRLDHLDPLERIAFSRLHTATYIDPCSRNGKSKNENGQGHHSDGSLYGVSPRLVKSTIKIYHIVFTLVGGAVLAGCAAASDLGFGKLGNVPVEYAQDVGLFVYDKAESFYYPGTDKLDVSNMMASHLQQVLPFNCQNALSQLFKNVELKERSDADFKSKNLAGYFEVKILKMRYDWPDPRATRFRADVELLVTFRTMKDRVVWSESYVGEGVGFSDPNIRLTRFGREASTALEDAFQDAVDSMQDGVLKSEDLRVYLRERWARSNPGVSSNASGGVIST